MSTENLHPLYVHVMQPQRRADGIVCQVKLKGRDDYLPFLAMPNDPEPHGREVYERCVRGDFGELVDYLPSRQAYLCNAVQLRADLLRNVNAIILYGQDMIDTGLATSTDIAVQQQWKTYRIALHDLDKQTGWPEAIDWPVSPSAI